MIQLFNRPIDWKASKQKIDNILTTKTELLSISHILQEGTMVE